MTANREPISVVGLGLMGTAISRRLLECGYPVFVWNRTPSKAEPLLSLGALWSEHPFSTSRRVIISLYSSDVVAQVVDQMQADLHAGLLVIDTTTGEPDDCIGLGRRLADCGIDYLDAPVSGSSQQTGRGEAQIMVGGDRDAYDACGDLWPCLGKSVVYMGASGSASRMKLVSNLILGLNRAALAEGLAFARAIGVEPAAALQVLQHSAAYSRVMDIKGRKMIEGDFSTQAKLSQHLKDVRIILKSAEAARLPLPLSQVHRQLLEQAEASGCGELDNSSIIEVYRGTRDV